MAFLKAECLLVTDLVQYWIHRAFHREVAMVLYTVVVTVLAPSFTPTCDFSLGHCDSSW